MMRDIINLSEKYKLKNPGDIVEFLQSNTDLIDVLLTGYDHIKCVVGEAEIWLELYHDPEIEGWDTLFIIIRKDLSVEDTIKLEDKLFNEWFINIIDKVATRLNYIIE